MGLAAAVSTALLGIGILALALAAVLAARVQPTRRPWIVDAGYTVQCALPRRPRRRRAGDRRPLRARLGACARPAGERRTRPATTSSAPGARNGVEGPVAGSAAIAVVSSSSRSVGLPPFELGRRRSRSPRSPPCCARSASWWAPLVLPGRRAPAPALRRLDSLLVLGPVWAWCRRPLHAELEPGVASRCPWRPSASAATSSQLTTFHTRLEEVGLHVLVLQVVARAPTRRRRAAAPCPGRGCPGGRTPAGR